MEKDSPLLILIGNPNCGKTTLFNQLTGLDHHVGNWPGVTVEKVTGTLTLDTQAIEVVDLPGIYSLSNSADIQALDEKIASKFILDLTAQHSSDNKTAKSSFCLINVVDAANLERNLFLTYQLLELGLPMILAVNMVDVAENKGLVINYQQLEDILQIPVIPLQGQKGQGLGELKQIILKQVNISASPFSLGEEQVSSQEQYSIQPRMDHLPSWLSTTIPALIKILALTNEKSPPQFLQSVALRLLEGDARLEAELVPKQKKAFSALVIPLKENFQEDLDLLIADARYAAIYHLLQKVQSYPNGVIQPKLTLFLDYFALHRLWGIPIFLGIMYLLFFFSICIGGAFQDFFDQSSNALFVTLPQNILSYFAAPSWLIALVAFGIGKGLNTTITFIPIIGGLFLFLSFLEDSGYMARAAFVVDRVMCALGLPGKAFIPLLVGFGCNVPAVLGARSLEYQRDRILTVMMTPFMSCGARLTLFAVFAAAFFPYHAQNVVFALYMIGILCAVLTGFILQKTFLKGQHSPLVMELPAYHLPQLSSLMRNTWRKLKAFILRAGKVIIPVCAILGAANAIQWDGHHFIQASQGQSILAKVGQYLTPIFLPLGIHANNWPATVGILTGILAKEVVLATLNTLYSHALAFSVIQEPIRTVSQQLIEAVKTIPQNFSVLGQSLTDPFLAAANPTTLSPQVFGQLHQFFDGKIGAFSYMLFVLLYIPCISTAAAIGRELGKGWMLLSVSWNTLLAYSVAAVFYQCAIHLPIHLEHLFFFIFGGLLLLSLSGLMVKQQRVI